MKISQIADPIILFLKESNPNLSIDLSVNSISRGSYVWHLKNSKKNIKKRK